MFSLDSQSVQQQEEEKFVSFQKFLSSRLNEFGRARARGIVKVLEFAEKSSLSSGQNGVFPTTGTTERKKENLYGGTSAYFQKTVPRFVKIWASVEMEELYGIWLAKIHLQEKFSSLPSF